VTLVATADDPHNLTWGWYCSRHQAQIVVLGGLKFTDNFLQEMARPYKYIGLTVKITHIWRDGHRAFYENWRLDNGVESANIHAKLAAPKLCASRWGSKQPVETRLDNCGMQQFVPCIKKVVAKRIKKDAKDPTLQGEASHTNNIVDEVGAEACTNNKLVMGRWRKEVYLNIGDTLYWAAIKINLLASEPVTHFENWMMSPVEPFHFGKLASLVCEKAIEISSSWDTILDDNPRWEVIFGMCTPGMLPSVNSFAVGLCLLNFSDFQRRITSESSKYRS
jgi:hypothetical protein